MPGDDLYRFGAVGGRVGAAVEITFARAGIQPAEKNLCAFAMESGSGFQVAVGSFKVTCFGFKSQKVCARLCSIGLTASLEPQPCGIDHLIQCV